MGQCLYNGKRKVDYTTATVLDGQQGRWRREHLPLARLCLCRQLAGESHREKRFNKRLFEANLVSHLVFLHFHTEKRHEVMWFLLTDCGILGETEDVSFTFHLSNFEKRERRDTLLFHLLHLLHLSFSSFSGWSFQFYSTLS